MVVPGMAACTPGTLMPEGSTSVGTRECTVATDMTVVK